MRAMIMAAGLGTRLQPLTGLIPKPMAPILNRPAMYHILQLLRRHGIREVVVNLHHFPDTITSYFGDGSSLGVSIRYSYEEELLGTAGGVKNNADFLGDGTFVVMSGDSLTDIDLTEMIESHCSRRPIATLAVKEIEDPSSYGVVVVGAEERVIGFQEKPRAEEALSHLCNCGIYVFEPAILDRIPAGSFFDFGLEVFPSLLSDREPFHVYRTPNYWNDVGSVEEYRRGNFDALLGRVEVEIPGREVSPMVYVGARTYVSPSARIEAPVLIGSDCRIEEDVLLQGPIIIGDHSIIERGAHLRAGITWSGSFLGLNSTIIGGIIGRGAHLLAHVHADGAVVGERCVIGEGSSLGSSRLEPHTVLGTGTVLG